MTNQQGAPEAPKSTALDGKTELFHVSGYPLLVRAVDFNRLYAENAALQQGYDAARLEIDHFRGATKTVAPAQPVAWLVYLPSEDAQRIYDSQDDIGYVDDLTNNADAKVIPLYTAQPSAAAAAKAPAAPTGWYALAADGMARLCVDRDDAAKEAANSEKKWPHLVPFRAVQLYTVPPAPTEQWVSVAERLPEWVHRDDTPCHINGKEVPPTLTSKTVLVALDGGGVRTDKLTTIEGKSNGWWNTYGERVIAWQDTPTPPQGAAKGADT